MIRKVSPGGTISTIAGNGTCGYSGDGGPATQAQIDPGTAIGGSGLAQSADGTLYLADSTNAAIRAITVDGTISTFASGIESEPPIPDVAVSTTDTVYVALGFHGLGTVAPDGTMTPVITGPFVPTVEADPDGGIFLTCIEHVVTCPGPDGVYHIDDGSTIQTFVAALPESEIFHDLSVDASGILYVLSSDHVLRVDPDGTVTTIAGSGGMDPGTGAQLGYALELPLSPMGIAATKNNGLLVSSGHVVYRIDKPAM